MESPRRGGSEGDILLGEGQALVTAKPPQSQPDKLTRQAKWQAANPKARWAHGCLQSALKRGLIERESCQVCGAAPTDGHHPDYDRPLAVVWLCRRHHQAEHRRERKHG